MESNTQLLGKIKFNNTKLKADLETIKNFPVFDEEYSEFNSGTWINNSLWNDDGNYKNTQYKDYSEPVKKQN